MGATYELSQHFVPGAWTHVALVFDTPAGNAPTLNVSLDGVTVLDKQVTPPICGLATVVEVTPGLFCVNANATDVDVRTDNLAIWTN